MSIDNDSLDSVAVENGRGGSSDPVDSRVELRASVVKGPLDHCWSGRTFWFLSESMITVAQDEILSNRGIVVALGEQSLRWARDMDLQVFFPVDFVEPADDSCIDAEAKAAATALLAELQLPRVSIDSTVVSEAYSMPLSDRSRLENIAVLCVQARRAVLELGRQGFEWRAPWSPIAWNPVHHALNDLTALVPVYLNRDHAAGRKFERSFLPARATRIRRSHFPPNETFINLKTFVYQAFVSVRRLVRSLRTKTDESPVCIAAVNTDLGRNNQYFQQLQGSGLKLLLFSLNGNFIGRSRKARRLSEQFHVPTAAFPGSRWLPVLLRRVSIARWCLTRLRHPQGDSEAARALWVLRSEVLDRWSVLISDYRAWQRLFRQIRPTSVVCVRTSWTTVIPAHAAVSLGIPTFTLPHGVFEWDLPALPDQKSSASVVRHLVAFKPSSTAEASGFVASKQALMPYEYAHTQGVKKTIAELNLSMSCNAVLILVDHCTIVNNGSVDAAVQAETLVRISAQNQALKLIVKDHPSHPQFARFLPKVLPHNLHVAEEDEDLHLLLERSGGVILWNYFGSALVHAILSGTPTAQACIGRGRNSQLPESAPKAWQEMLKQVPRLDSEAAVSAWIGDLIAKRIEPIRSEAVQSLVADGGPSLEEFLRPMNELV